MADEQQHQQQGLDGGTYEVIRRRLSDQAQELRTRVGQLNARRTDIFGGTETKLLDTFHLQTEHNCVARDIVRAQGNKLIFGYQVFMGLKRATAVADVFAKFQLDDGALLPAEREALTHPAFVKDFSELFQYYKDARLLQLRRTETHLLMVFQVGGRAGDVKVLRWALDGDGLKYIDNRGERDHVFPPRHSWEWTRTTRDMHVYGQHAHINIDDTIFVECTEGDLTIKIEDNTASGDGIYAEPVDNATQGLDDAQIAYAHLESCIVLRMRPYQESVDRYIVYNKQTAEAVRLDPIGVACQELPEGHGLIFPNGYYLATGDYKVFPHRAEGMAFVRAVRSPNGEDIAYVFHDTTGGNYIILQYNLISREVANPILCSGYALYPNGRLVLFRADDAPTRSHTMQVWATPFEDETYALAKPRPPGSHLATIGNRDLVRAISDCLHIVRLVADQKPSRVVYEDLLATITRTLDQFHWLGHDEACGLREQLLTVQKTADQVIGEFEKVQELTKQATQQVRVLHDEVRATLREVAIAAYEHIDEFVSTLSAIRRRRGQVQSLRELRYADAETLDRLDSELGKAADERSRGAVEFLLQPEAVQPYYDEVAGLEAEAQATTKTADLRPIVERMDELGSGLDMLMEIVGGLDIDDPVARTQILERISEVYGRLNRAKAVAAARRSELGSHEGQAEFAAQFTILSQTANNYLGLAKEPSQVDDFLGKLLLQLEEIEGRFIEFDAFTEQLSEKREEIYEAFQGRKQTLLDERQRQANSLARAADRILDGVRKRALGFSALDDLNAWFATDPMLGKLRDIVKRLLELGDTVKADDVESRIKASREDGVRALRDKSELFEGEVVRLGKHRFSRNLQDLELTLLPRDDGMCFHLTGTDYYEAVRDEAFLATRRFWNEDLVSEDSQVYRGEYLAMSIIRLAEEGAKVGDTRLSPEALHKIALDETELTSVVRRVAGDRYEEGYERGLHDADTVQILRALLHLRSTCGLIRFPPSARALAMLWWADLPDGEQRKRLARRCRSLLSLRGLFGTGPEQRDQVAEMAELIATYEVRCGLASDGESHASNAASYLLEELAAGDEFAAVRSGEAEDCEQAFWAALAERGADERLRGDLARLAASRAEQWRLASAWLRRWAEAAHREWLPVIDEVALGLCLPELPRSSVHARSSVVVDGLLGQHPRITSGRIELRLDDVEERLSRFMQVRIPAYRAYHDQRRDLVAHERRRLRLEEFKPKVLTSFVRNKLINDAYLPMIGDNLAKQMGAVGDAKRTDLMGMLLLISPPGYGKTTLMEYVASVLGLTFMKINGPSLGHQVTSLDPEQAPNATARQELEKLNLSFEMSNNIMIYIDDIQHCDPEFLQKFISLCDGQRRIEGVWRGRTRTYDMRGKKVAVVMAGNPYTESGDRFRIPDMLANRADTYNLGDILGGHQAAFELSYLENCLTVNPVLSPIASRSQADFYRLLRISQGEDELRSELEHPYSGLELEEICEVLRKLTRIQQVLLKVNMAYIHSASMADEYRTEPAFKLQGSYRNMAKLAEKVVPVMNDAELEELIIDHYRGEAQTLTTGAEANLLKLYEIAGRLDEEQAARWTAIKRSFVRHQELSGSEDDPMQRALLQLVKVNEHLGDIGGALVRGQERVADGHPLLPALEKLGEVLANSRSADDAPAAADASAALASAIGQLGQALEGDRSRPIQVVNTLPKYYANLYRHHIEVIENSLQPALTALGRHLDNSGAISANLRELVNYLRKRADKHDGATSLNLPDGDGQQIEDD